jgi:hypothetical protein
MANQKLKKVMRNGASISGVTDMLIGLMVQGPHRCLTEVLVEGGLISVFSGVTLKRSDLMQECFDEIRMGNSVVEVIQHMDIPSPVDNRTVLTKRHYNRALT